ncbi:MAG: prepilin-type N-terminal cleavage/methylation domain-containing protein [Magnetococcales bacterium]|nr:prepilin-type N-terminal cleavage/methylation domain-containing protein [Magnetococcales bacterium]
MSIKSIKNQSHTPENGFTLVEIMLVMVIIGILTTLGVSQFRKYVITAHLEDAQGYMMAIAAKERLYHTKYGTYYAAIDEQDIEDTLGVDLRDASNFCFVVRTGTSSSDYISASANVGAVGDDDEAGFEVWAILRSEGGANDTVTVYPTISPSSVTCTTADQKNSATGWVDSDGDEIGGEGRVVVLRYPASVDGIETASRNNRTDFFLDWNNGFTITDALF